MNVMHFYTTSTTEPAAGYVSEGITANVLNHQTEDASAFNRWRHPESNLHFYTTDPNGEAAPAAGYVFEKIECYVPNPGVPGTIPLYRWYNPNTGDHLYTLDKDGELGPASGYVAEGISCYVFPLGSDGTVPLYRWVAGDQTWCIRLSRSSPDGHRYVVFSKNVHVSTYEEAKALAQIVYDQYNFQSLPEMTANFIEEPKLGGC
ncbi:hypothetical protein [Pseudomonas umsongensis]|uniref:DUF5648 domain-containing protein n=1 Tax=Pseudomonas umsongensis TaxID=198618 RepID=A0AAE6ZT63_9PSED|nr:hypothetical protein [Pseudomonas umsongensis]QJC78917.1 hypothetical protein HGP31_11550 [Pseudomonas umsongensis]